jgi:hypothetical protein
MERIHFDQDGALLRSLLQGELFSQTKRWERSGCVFEVKGQGETQNPLGIFNAPAHCDYLIRAHNSIDCLPSSL